MSGLNSIGLGLVGDIGGTNARFALVDFDGADPRLIEPTSYKGEDYGTAEDAIEHYLAKMGLKHPDQAVVAVAGPIEHGTVHFTNSDWKLSEDSLRRAGGFRTARLINDFTAQALAAPRLAPKDLRQIGPLQTSGEGDVAILGPGTGFGAAGMVRRHGVETPLTTEGGHIAFAPFDEVEIEVLRILMNRFGRCSIERILSGPGMEDLHMALAEVEGRKADELTAKEITEHGVAGDACCKVTIDRFCAILGSAAGDLALALGARGGVFIAGGIGPRIVDLLEKSEFRSRFESKGRLSDYTKAIPTHVVMNPHTALIGAAVAMTPDGKAAIS
ncbi:glucokinase [Caulobacter sp. Root1455]|uniref:glucokinase n=1 Tax=unclassified Caulobacter TaxID=2648921 RepID=UPI0006F7DF16|nr:MULTISPECIES: glucokinase [unclassified Caulobacter]KQY31208.1 glucokinase [Caulobacter sp. Root487D2Y]KQY95500.1 glucokinase [Caulobacter sp. Root1455]